MAMLAFIHVYTGKPNSVLPITKLEITIISFFKNNNPTVLFLLFKSDYKATYANMK